MLGIQCIRGQMKNGDVVFPRKYFLQFRGNGPHIPAMP